MCGETEERLCEQSKKNKRYQGRSLQERAEEGPAVRIQYFLHQ